MDTSTDSGADEIPRIDPDCTDGLYAETLPTAEPDLSDWIAAFDTTDPEVWVGGVLERRYPDGAWLLANAPELGGDTCGGTFLGLLGDAYTDTPEHLALAATALVHECAHLVDGEASEGDLALFVLRQDLSLWASGGAAPPSPARSRLLGDAFAAARPPCADEGTGGCDTYADVYLTGDSTDEVFDSGDQGLDNTTEELTQYIHSLMTALALSDLVPQANYRDGVLTFLWYTERLLYLWRSEDPDGWRRAMDEGGYASLLLNLWGQAWGVLDATDGMGLGWEDEALEALVLEPALLGEIAALRGVVGCGG